MIRRILDLIRLSLVAPEEALAQLRALDTSPREQWQAIAAVCALATLVSSLTLALLRGPGYGGPVSLLGSFPLLMAAAQFGAAALFAVLVARVGAMFGGKAGFADALLITAWIEVAMLTIQIPQVLIGLLLPGIAGLLGIAIFILYFVLAAQMIRAVHGFRNPMLVGLGMIGTLFVTAFALSLVAASLGIMPESPL